VQGVTADVLLVGGGKMGEALLGGWLAAGHAPDAITVVEPIAPRREELAERYGVTTVAEPVAGRGAVLAVKPDVVPAAAAAVGAAGADRVLSIAAGVGIGTIESALGGPTPVVRAMPNTPALVRCGAAAIAGGTHVTDDDLAWAEGLLAAVGTVVRVSEAQLDAVTGLSGSGPAYVFLVAEALTEAGVLQGLARPVAFELAAQTLRGAAELLVQDPTSDPARLRADVTSPGGTTAAGLRVLEQRAVRAALLDAVAAATERSRELGRAAG
jgi:pyrroline-5-carboxylate reductase